MGNNEPAVDQSDLRIRGSYGLNNSYIPFNSNFNFMPCRLHPASNGNAISESHPKYEGHAHHYVIT